MKRKTLKLNQDLAVRLLTNMDQQAKKADHISQLQAAGKTKSTIRRNQRALEALIQDQEGILREISNLQGHGKNI